MKQSLAKYILVFTSLFVMNSMLLAQEKKPFKRNVFLGVKATALSSEYSFVPSVPQKLYLGFGAGVMARVDVERGASLQLELNYLRTGWQEKFEDKPDLAYHRSINTINMPFLTHLYLSSKSIRFFVNLGPILGYVLSEDKVVKDPLLAKGKSSFTDFAQYRHHKAIERKLFWGLCGGPGISFCVGKAHRLELEGRYTYGLGDVFSNKREDPYGQSAERRLSLSISYNYRF